MSSFEADEQRGRQGGKERRRGKKEEEREKRGEKKREELEITHLERKEISL